MTFANSSFTDSPFDLSDFDFVNSVSLAKQHFDLYIRKLLENYELRHQRRKEQNIQVVNFVGHGRTGKDEAAKMFAARTHADYQGATSLVVNPMIAWSLGLSEDESYNRRHENRNFWYLWCNEFRKSDPSLLARLLLGSGDICVGTRSQIELAAALKEGVVDVLVWVSREGVPPDPTLEFDFDTVKRHEKWYHILNDGSLADLDASVTAVAEHLGMLVG